jgi:hypothetical protein
MAREESEYSSVRLSRAASARGQGAHFTQVMSSARTQRSTAQTGRAAKQSAKKATARLPIKRILRIATFIWIAIPAIPMPKAIFQHRAINLYCIKISGKRQEFYF